MAQRESALLLLLPDVDSDVDFNERWSEKGEVVNGLQFVWKSRARVDTFPSKQVQKLSFSGLPTSRIGVKLRLI